MVKLRGIVILNFFLIGTLLAAGCTSSSFPVIPVENTMVSTTPTLPLTTNLPILTPLPVQNLRGSNSSFISIDPIPDFRSGDKIRIKGTTNLNKSDGLIIFVDTEICSNVIPRLRNPQCCNGQNPRVKGYTHVFNSDSGDNTWSFDFDTSGFPTGKYQVDVIGEVQGIEVESSFNLSGLPIDPACIQ